jgi:hypothetical protein
VNTTEITDQRCAPDYLPPCPDCGARYIVTRDYKEVSIRHADSCPVLLAAVEPLP